MPFLHKLPLRRRWWLTAIAVLIAIMVLVGALCG